MTAARELTVHLRRISALERVSGLLHWDQETQMPARGAAQRAEEAGAVAAALHAAAVDPRLADLLDAAEAEATHPRAVAEVAEARRLRRHATRVPVGLAAELAEATASAQVVWQDARAASRFADFAPALERVVRLKRSEAACLAETGAPYDALIDLHEPGMTAEETAALFDALRPGLVELRARLAATGRRPPRLSGHFPAQAQRALARRIGDAFGYDWTAGRIDLAAHPSCNGSFGDVRITTRIDESDPFDCIYSTIHEIGHALYEQGLDPEAALSFAGAAASMGVHELQSRLMENQIGRSRAFAEWLYPQMRSAFGEIGVDGPDALHAVANVVETGFIRTEADEVHYNLHVLMRFDLERALIAGDLAVADLEGAWSDRFAADFGIDAAGCRARRAAGRALVGRRLRLFPDLYYRQRLCGRTRRGASGRSAGLGRRRRARRPRSRGGVAPRPHPPARPHGVARPDHRRRDRPSARSGDLGREPRGQVRRPLRPLLTALSRPHCPMARDQQTQRGR